MSPLNPRLEHILSQARLSSPPPSQRLETLVISAWRDRSSGPGFPSIYPFALACACGLLILAFVVSYGTLAGTECPAVLLANTAIHQAIHP